MKTLYLTLVAMLPAAAAWSGETGEWPAKIASERAACAALLSGLDIAWKSLDPIGDGHGCGAAAPIEVSAIDGVRLDPPATINCRLALGLHDWIANTVQPAAARDLKTRVTVIHTASSYACRARNSQKGGKLSEHGHADALDMAGFSFAKSDAVTVTRGWRGPFLEHIRAGACRSFTTVLGPGSDAYHGTHFHVDTIQRRNGWRVCN